MRQKQIDFNNWILGMYIESAVSVAIEHNLAGRKARSKYIEKPYSEQAEEQERLQNLSEEEKRRQTENFFLRLQVMQANYELEKKIKGGAE